MNLAKALEFYGFLRSANLKPDTIESVIWISSMSPTEKGILSGLNKKEAEAGRRIDWQNLKPLVLELYNSDYALIRSGVLSEYPLQIGKIYPN